MTAGIEPAICAPKTARLPTGGIAIVIFTAKLQPRHDTCKCLG